MKRMNNWLLLLLAAVLLLSACQPGVTESITPSGESSAEDTSSKEETENGERLYTLVSVGKPYTLNVEPSGGGYDDFFDQQLTDGLKTPDVGAHYIDSRMVGFSSDLIFTVDLGEDGKRISAIVARSLDQTKDGVKLAHSARFYGSNDGKSFDRLGTVEFEETGFLTVSSARLELEEVTDYRYIRIRMRVGIGGAFIFLDELEVYADVPAKEETDTVALAYGNENIDRMAWKALSTGREALPAASENAAAGASYTFENCTFDERAPENDKYLTDGERTTRLFSESVWVGMQAKEKDVSSIKVDLGKKHSDLYHLRVHALGSGIDVRYADYIDAYGSEDGKNYTFLGRMYAPLKGDNYTYTLLLPEYISARYLRLDLAPGAGNYWLEEIEVFAGLENIPEDSVYGDVSFPKVTEEVYWDGGDADYSETQNLILGKLQQIATSYYAPATVKKEHTPGDSPILTDGKRATSKTCYAPDWFFASGGNAIDFFFDLGAVSTLESFKVHTLDQKSWGISRPKFVTILLSNDGNLWYPVSDSKWDESKLGNSFTPTTLEFTLGTPYAARFVRFRVECGYNESVWLDELEAFGTKEVKEGTVLVQNSGIIPNRFYTNEEDKQYATTENTDVKAHDISFINTQMTDLNRLLPYVAYLDEEGNITDTFMDGFVLSNGEDLPSKSKVAEASYKKDWDHLFNCLFNGPTGMNHVEEVVGTVKDALNKPDYKVQIYLSLFPIRDTVTDFGDVDGDGISEDLTKAEDRRKVLEWFTDLCLEEFASRGYKNLELGGFYWGIEAIGYWRDDSHLVKETADVIHDRGSQLLWIPYYVANRYYTGYELGFDLVCMQPNVMFTGDVPLWQFTHTAEVSKQTHMSVEIEHSYQALSDPHFVRNYMLYLYYGAVTGYDEGVRIYYDDRDNFAQMARSDLPLCRMQYESTYRFAKGTLEVYPETVETLTFTAKKDTILDGTLNGEGVPARYTPAGSPEHGSVVLSVDGTFRYLPEPGYTGKDTFAYTYNNYLGESQICYVEITVE